ncbi:respiratory supercomplex factor 1, mitochondrial [Phanerochaete sordida]|uniref:Respiratory supercomplex factor 1, mitochondrial n=1 Tax=Phanerochaete sordida TaxID=48140 RepID=A0A9P3GED8_9APHY|nr:respiratory supercomplex factor 1, mitochondrial [Phanerochaete sordida]
MDLLTTVSAQSAQERWQDKLVRKCKEEPYVPIGTALTCFALYMAIRKSGRNGDPKALNRWFRARIMFQGATVAAIVVGSYTLEARKTKEAERLKELEQDPATKERLAFEARLKAAEEAHAFELAMEKAKAEKDPRSMWEKLGLGRGSHKNREAAAAAETTAAPTSSSPTEPAPVAAMAPTTAETVTTASAATTSVPGGTWGWFGMGSKPKEPEKKD